MSEQKETEKREEVLKDLMWVYQMLIGNLHEGISKLSGEAQDIMLQAHAKTDVEGMLLAMSLISSRDPRTFNVDEMIKHHEPIENHYANGKASIAREGNIITWKSNLSYCYDPKIENGMIKPYPAYCRQCHKYFFEGLYGIAHKGPVKSEGVKGVLKGDDECVVRIELL